MATRSEFARHFGPAALRLEVRARYKVPSPEPRRVRPVVGPLPWALRPADGWRLVAAWAAHARSDPREVSWPDETLETPSDIHCVCALYVPIAPTPGVALVVWGAVRIGQGEYRDVGCECPEPVRLYVGRATGPALVSPDGCLHATNEPVTCHSCGGRIHSCVPNSREVYPCYPRVVSHEDADRYVRVYVSYGYAGSRLASDHVSFSGFRRRGGRVLPPARLAAGRAYYRDAPRLAAATACLGRRGVAALRHTYASTD